jgi:hypothetical protein
LLVNGLLLVGAELPTAGDSLRAVERSEACGLDPLLAAA